MSLDSLPTMHKTFQVFTSELSENRSKIQGNNAGILLNWCSLFKTIDARLDDARTLMIRVGKRTKNRFWL